MRVWEDWLLSAARAAIHLPTRTVVVSDLHLGYGEARRRGGEAVPLQSVAQCLERLGELLTEQRIAELILAGDVFEAGATSALCDELLCWIETAGDLKVRLLAGNHDRGLSKAPEGLLPVRAPILLGDWQVVHGDRVAPSGRVVQGHLHPALRVQRDLPLAPCFLTRPGHLVLPAYCAEAAGVNVKRSPRWEGYACHVIVNGEIL